LRLRAHKLFFGTVWANDLLPVCDEAATSHTLLTKGAEKALRMPMTPLKADEPGAPLPSDWLATTRAPLCKELPKAVGAVGFVLPVKTIVDN